MIKKLKRQIALTLSITISILLVVILVFVNVIFIQQSAYDIYTKMQSASAFVWKMREDVPMANYDDISVVLVSKFGSNVVYNCDEFETDDETLLEIAKGIAEKQNGKNSSGQKNGYLFLTRGYGDATTLVMLYSNESLNERAKTLRQNSILMGGIGIIAIVWCSKLLARWLVKPVQESIENERAFVSDASHELKTPLAVISSNADALETEVGESKWLNCIRSESMRMSGLINDMLTISKIENNNDRSTFKQIDFSACVEEMEMNFEAPAFDKGILINCDIQEHVMVHGNEEKLKQVVAILIDNAVKYVDENGEIKVSLKSKLGTVTLTVENSGSYVSKEDQKRIFERFYRADSSRTKDIEESAAGHKTRSYGLGLAIAKRIVEAHEGNISVSSTKTGEGETEKLCTVFKVTF